MSTLVDLAVVHAQLSLLAFGGAAAVLPEMQRAATKGVTHPNTVARKLSRLSARIKALGAG